MAKISLTDNDWENLYDTSYQWDDFIRMHCSEPHDWTNNSGQPWQWYMELSIRLREGWQHIKIGPAYNSAAVINWLRNQGAMYKSSYNEFLIRDPKIATMMRLKYA